MNTREIIESAFERRSELGSEEIESEIRPAVEQTLDALEEGSERVAQPVEDGWQVNEWLKKAVLLSFAISDNQVIPGGHTAYYDKVPCRWGGDASDAVAATGARVVMQLLHELKLRGLNLGDAEALAPRLELSGHIRHRRLASCASPCGCKSASNL